MEINKFNSIISIIGLSNVGKSFLFNKILNNYKSIINKKIHFTRKLIIDILPIKETTNLLIDTPGFLFKRKYKLHFFMLKIIKKSINLSNIILYVTQNKKRYLKKDIYFISKYKEQLKNKTKFLIVFNNTNKKKINLLYLKFFKIDNIIIIPNNKKHIYKELIKTIYKKINKNKIYSDFYYDNLYNQTFFISEIIRGYIYKIYKKEIPYSSEIYINKILKNKNYIYIDSLVYLEKKSQKKIFIGYRGKNINLLSYLIRKKIKKIYHIKKVYIKFDFFIIKWKNNNKYLKLFQYLY
ncbi:MAG: GTPase Era [Candidatus Shikimatogenerans bostrichidophilus]|nr:MAG: GTPase Era [Candidatus Shikimatogenerans bostrichidophilus]